MKIGIISDTHDNIAKVKAAVNLFNKEEVGFVIHCGDYIAPFSLISFSGLNCDWTGVFGNCDGEKVGLKKISGDKIKEAPLVLTLGNKTIIVVHNIQSYKGEEADIVLFGHTHNVEVRRGEAALFINPGEAAGWLTGDSTVAILDTDTLGVEIKGI
ncbi:MAG: metallophosphoesterase [Candidatus Kaelpia aquatica]|nr:metallophosphoesterase [Candidatus Kaelpia aquatica]